MSERAQRIKHTITSVRIDARHTGFDHVVKPQTSGARLLSSVDNAVASDKAVKELAAGAVMENLDTAKNL